MILTLSIEHCRFTFLWVALILARVVKIISEKVDFVINSRGSRKGWHMMSMMVIVYVGRSSGLECMVAGAWMIGKL